MKIAVGELRLLVQEAMKKQRGIRLIRVGGLSPVWQKKGSAPERRGVWAFIWPYSEPFLLGSTGPEGTHPGEGKTRYDQLQREGWRRFVHVGRLYTRIPVTGAREVDGWYLTDGAALADYMTKHFANMTKWTRQEYPSSSRLAGSNPWLGYSKDEFEVFVPKPDEGGF